MEEIRICGRDEIPDGGARIIEIGRLEIGVIRHKDTFYAYRNLCPHQGGPACEGVRMAGVVDLVEADGSYHGQQFDEGDMHIVCPWHGYEYHLETGVNVCDAKLKLRKFEVKEKEGGIYVCI